MSRALLQSDIGNGGNRFESYIGSGKVLTEVESDSSDTSQGKKKHQVLEVILIF